MNEALISFLYTGYYIIDAEHGMCITAGDNSDGNAYHQHPRGRLNAKWTVEPVGGNKYKDYFFIKDLKHGMYLSSSSGAFDHYMYHTQLNPKKGSKSKYEHAMWKLEMVAPKAFGSPAFRLIDKKHEKEVAAGKRQDNNLYQQDLKTSGIEAYWVFIPTN